MIDITPTVEVAGATPIAAAKDRIRAAMAPAAQSAERVEDEKPKAAATDLAGGFTYAQVRDALEKAKDADARATARDMIRGVPSEEHRGELTKLADLLDEKPEA